MVWKIKNKKNSNDNTKAMHSSLRSSGSGSTGTMISKSPGKSCLRKLGDSLDSDWSNSGSSVASSQRSDTFKCDQSSLGTPGSTPRSNNSNGSCENSSRTSSQASDSLDARISAAARAHNVSFPASAPLSAGVRSTGSSGSGSQKNRAVRFSVVEIRDYEREIADNPSCSCGPPIGIGWSHLDSRVVHLNHYESSRPYRKGQLEMTLTREEREALLQEWGVSSHEIVSSTRALNKAKNQRRQTVRNLNKAERLEESIEGATRKLKKVLSLRRSTKTEVEELQRQADLAAAMLRRIEVEEGEVKSGGQASHGTEITEDEGTLGSFEVKVAPTTEVAPASPATLKERTVPTTSVSREDMDTISCISGFTLGNSTTASAREIERFHRELELEMFGYQELPSMVGQTLEVDVEIPEEDKVYYEPSNICGSKEPPSVVSSLWEDQLSRSEPQGWQQLPPQGFPSGGYPDQSLLGQQLAQAQFPIRASYNVHGNTIYGNYEFQSQDGYHVANHNVRLSSSFDRCDMGAHVTLIRPNELNMQQQFPTVPPMHPRNAYADEPAVAHVPLASHLSATTWMEGPTTRSLSSWRGRQCDAVIISEDDLDVEVMM